MPTHRANLDRLAATGLPIHITELDIPGNDDSVQLANYQRIFPVFWEHPAVEGITLWGYHQNTHWRRASGDWLMYANGAQRPALTWLVAYVGNTQPVIPAKQKFKIDEHSPAGTVVGTVTDQTGAVVSGADVELKKAATNEVRVTRTNDSGIYRFDAVDLGTYDVIVKATGFKTMTTTSVQVQANQTATINAQMEVGTEQIVVNISAGAGDLLQTSEPVKGGNFNPLQVSSLPSTNLNPYDLGRLLPGVVTASGGATFGNSAQFSVNGQRPQLD